MSILNWVEQRTGVVSAAADFLTEDVPGGASYWYIFGSATTFAMILQIVTGIFLTFYYAPSAATAWESTNYIYHHVPLGWFVIGLHYWGATAMIAMVLLHFLQVLIWGAYKAPREVSWIIGVVLLIVTLVLGLTGYLLPWDMNAYFASQVAINIASSVPIVGPPTQQFLAGSSAMGTLTINRFFGLHVWLMPALLVLLVGAHLSVFRHNGGAGPPVDTELKRLPQGRFWPNQMFMDAVASFVLMLVIALLAAFVAPPLDAKADPTQQFIAYPAWYFLALYGLLRLAGQAPQQLVPLFNLLATVIIPGLAVTVLILLPFIDRNPSRRLSKRPWAMSITALAVVMAVGLSIWSQLAIIKEQAEAKGQTAPVATGTSTGTGGAGGLGSGGSSQLASTSASSSSGNGARIYSTNCAGCHGAGGTGVPGAFPPLAGNPYVTGDTKPLIHTLIAGMQGQPVMGKPYPGQMPAWKGQLSNADIAAVLTYIRSSWGNKAGPIAEAQVAAQAK